MADDDSESPKNSAAESGLYQAVPAADKELANNALQEFQQSNFEQCLHFLIKLLSKRPQDTKVFHNVAVSEFYVSNSRKSDVLNKKLNEICALAHIELQDLESMEDLDNCVVLYNQAVILYHLHQYNAAINILDKVYQFIAPLDENLAKNISFLLLELHLCISQPKKASNHENDIEGMVRAKNENKDKDNQKEEITECQIPEACTRRLQLYRARCYAMLKTSKACKREIKNLMSTGTPVLNIPAFYLKSQLEYLRGNYTKAVKLLNSVTLPEDMTAYFKDTGDCLPAIYYNNVGCIHFYMGKPNLGQFYLQKAIKALNKELNSVTFENENKINTRPLHLTSISAQHQLNYNLGMQFFHARLFKEAFSCFKEALRSYHSNARLWLRIAECCIQIHKPDNMDQFVKCKLPSFINSIVGMGIHRKLILNSFSDRTSDGTKSSNYQNLEVPSLTLAMFCLKNALFLVGENSISSSTGQILSNIQSSNEDTDSAVSEENNILPTLPANYIQGIEVISLKNSILAAASYVALSLGDIILAHEYAKMLLLQPRVSAAHKFLAHMYAGESLLLMDRITEAVEHLSYQSPSDIILAHTTNSKETTMKHQPKLDSKLNEKNDDGSRPVGNIPEWFPNTISSAKFITQYNLAVAYAVREEWSKSLECLLQINPGGNVPTEALSLLIYVQTHQGCAEDTKNYVKQFMLRDRA